MVPEGTHGEVDMEGKLVDVVEPNPLKEVNPGAPKVLSRVVVMVPRPLSPRLEMPRVEGEVPEFRKA